MFWRLVFLAKHRAGFLDMGRDITVIGTVWRNDGTSDDGDTCFSVIPDDSHLWAVYMAGRHTSEAPAEMSASLHCEVAPWSSPALHRQALALRPGDRVQVTGRWGYDGVHTGRGVLWDVIAAIFGHGPDMVNGWLELHPVESIDPVPTAAKIGFC